MISIVPLSKENVDEALVILDEQYGRDPENSENFKTWLPASLSDSDDGSKLKAEAGIDYLQYWVAVDVTMELVIGVTGIYTKSEQKDLAWLAWTSARSDGIVEALEDLLISFSSNVALNLGKSRLADFIDEGEKDVFVMDMLNRNGFIPAEISEKSEAPENSVHLVKYISLLGVSNPVQGNPPPPDNRPKEQGSIAVSSGMGEVNQIVRAYHEGGLARQPYTKISAMLQEAATKIASDAWQQGHEAHPECDNPYKAK